MYSFFYTIGIGSSINIEGFPDKYFQFILSLFSSNNLIAPGLPDKKFQKNLS